MISGLYNGLSGIFASSSAVNVASNNIANVNNIGHKEDQISFEDMMYKNGSYGKGVANEIIQKSFHQGGIKDTSNAYDFAIQGKGFFIVTDPETNESYYTRAGNFQESSDGTLINNEGFTVMGLQTQIISTTSSNDTVAFGDTYTKHLASSIITQEDRTVSINAKATDYTKTATDVGISGQNYKSATSVISDVEALKTNYNEKLKLLESNPNEVSVASTFQQTNLTYSNYNNELTNSNDFVELYLGTNLVRQYFDTDALTTMNKFADKISDLQGFTSSFDSATGTLTIDNLIPGNNTKISSPVINSSAPIIEVIDAVEGSGLAMVESARDALNSAVQLANAEFLDIQNGIPAPNQATLSLESINLKLTNIGLASYNDTSLSVSDDGILLLTQGTNTYIAGRVSTAYFPDEQSLKAEGSNLYSATKASGEAKNADTLNEVVSNSVEVSNISVSTGLQKLLIAQRAFEANSKSITTSDEFLKTAIALKTS
ncbi:flagellar hook-basal body complex protein [Arcobacter sp.]|uniref:flagellar hook-basal body complex protein n=1 Tax=Arcobacter sp. TaxID=1872629 RepID=UPI003D153350